MVADHNRDAMGLSCATNLRHLGNRFDNDLWRTYFPFAKRTLLGLKRQDSMLHIAERRFLKGASTRDSK
jgi:hypothetical protein